MYCLIPINVFINILGHNPELLSIAHLTWNHGLPAETSEVEIINRMRIRRTWEAILPPMDTALNIKKRKAILTKLEIEEWAFRESISIFLLKI